MKIVNTNPPNYSTIVSALPHVAHTRGLVFTYGDTIYNPSNGVIDEALDAHESVHWEVQQKTGIDEWWAKYLDDPAFRFEQELMAYRAQYKVILKIYPRAERKRYLQHISKALCGAFYGNICKDWREAKQLITEEK